MRKIMLSALICCFIFGCETLKVNELLGKMGGALSGKEIASGLREALSVGIRKGVDNLSTPGKFTGKGPLHITLPKELNGMAKTLRSFGGGSLVDSLEYRMNLAVEKSMASALPVFRDAIMNMSFEDAKKILNGGDSSATDYLRRRSEPILARKFRPIMTDTLKKAGVFRIYDQLLSKYNALPLTKKPDMSLENYLTRKGLDSLFAELARQEKMIRENPKARTTELLRRVFGGTN